MFSYLLPTSPLPARPSLHFVPLADRRVTLSGTTPGDRGSGWGQAHSGRAGAHPASGGL